MKTNRLRLDPYILQEIWRILSNRKSGDHYDPSFLDQLPSWRSYPPLHSLLGILKPASHYSRAFSATVWAARWDPNWLAISEDVTRKFSSYSSKDRCLTINCFDNNIALSSNRLEISSTDISKIVRSVAIAPSLGHQEDRTWVHAISGYGMTQPKTHCLSATISRRQRTQVSKLAQPLRRCVNVCQRAISEFDRCVR